MDLIKSEYFFLLYLTKTKFKKSLVAEPKYGSLSEIENELIINFSQFKINSKTLAEYVKKYVENGLIIQSYVESKKRNQPVNGYMVNKTELIKFIKKSDIYIYTRDLIKENGLVLD